MKAKELTKRLDKGAMYFWSKEIDGRYRLVNAFTLKTAAGVECRVDAMKMTKALTCAGYTIAKMEENQ